MSAVRPACMPVRNFVRDTINSLVVAKICLAFTVARHGHCANRDALRAKGRCVTAGITQWSRIRRRGVGQRLFLRTDPAWCNLRSLARG
jgi:hypothetical protein